MRILFVSLGISILLYGLFVLMLAILGLNPKNRIQARGVLASCYHYKNVRVKSFLVIKNMVDFTYIYEVNGKPYRFKANKNIHSRKVFKRATIVYLRGFPRVAYLERFTGANEWLLGSFLLIIGGMFTYVAFTSPIY